MRTIYLPALALFSLTGCVAVLPTKVQTAALDDFGSSEVYSRAFPGNASSTCEASRRALLSQGYVVEDSTTTVTAHKNFQPAQETHVQVRFTVTCADNNKGSRSATVFVNAVKDRYSLRKSSNSASVGIPAVSFSLPLTSTDEAMVKVASETISSKKFYNHFFDTVERYIDVEEIEAEESPKPAFPAPSLEKEVPHEEPTKVEPATQKIESEEILEEKTPPPASDEHPPGWPNKPLGAPEESAAPTL